MKRSIPFIVSLVLLVALSSRPAAAQQRPLVTEDPESVGSGLILVEGGFDYVRDQPYPVSGLEGHRVRVPVLGLSIGVSSIAEIQIDGLSYQGLNVTRRSEAPLSSLVDFEGNITSDMTDFVIGAKTRVLSETGRRPAIGLRFATRLPNAGNQSGLGLDTFDFINTILVAKTVGFTRVVGNIGLGILADATRGDRQNDVIMYGLSMARGMSDTTQIVVEVNGHANIRRGHPPPGTDSSSHLRVGARYTLGTVRFDAALIAGLTARDPTVGVTAGLTWVFQGMEVP